MLRLILHRRPLPTSLLREMSIEIVVLFQMSQMVTLSVMQKPIFPLAISRRVNLIGEILLSVTICQMEITKVVFSRKMMV